MILPNSHSETKKKVVAVGLLSGGLDSTIACKVMIDLGVEVHGVYFAQPWGCCDKQRAFETAERLGIKFVPMQLDERYLDIIKTPKHGYGSALNPCKDCRIHMFYRAGQYMKAIGGDFVFTGEVLGQRPMSQMRHSMAIIERDAGLEGRLLRPLCAQLMEPTIPEQEGLIDRSKLLRISGRSRKEQRELAEGWGFHDLPNPAGGCLLTDHNFAARMKDSFKYGYRNFRETIALKWGRHFRLSAEFKAVLGRDEEECISLESFAHPDDTIMVFPNNDGPVAVIKGANPTTDILSTVAGLMQRFSKHKDAAPITMKYWVKKEPNAVAEIAPKKLSEHEIEKIKI